VTDQAKLPFERAATIAEDCRPGDVDCTGASLRSLRYGHHIECPRRDGCEAKEAEQQAGACPEPHKCTDVVSTQAHHDTPIVFLPGSPGWINKLFTGLRGVAYRAPNYDSGGRRFASLEMKHHCYSAEIDSQILQGAGALNQDPSTVVEPI